jgi:hypothetical protein
MTNGRFYRDADGNLIDEDEAFVNGVLKDGITVTVPTRLRDSERAAAADPDSVKRRVVRVRDGFGNPAGRRPGFVTSIASDQVASRTKRLRDQAYADYEKDISNRWRGGDDDGDGDFIGAAEGDACTGRCEEFPLAQGAPGHLRRYGNRLVCVPDSTTDSRRQDRRHDARTVNDAARAHRQRMADVYREHDARLSNAWRNEG